MKHSQSYLLAFALSGALMLSCNREEKTKPELEVESINNESQAQAEFDDLQSVTEDAMERNDSVMNGRIENLISCGAVNINPSNKTITIDFGSTGVLCADGRTRKGLITIQYTGKYRDSATVITTTLTNYEVKPISQQNFVKVEGTKTVTNQGRTTNGKITFRVQISNGKLTFSDNSTITFTSTRTRVWDKGDSTNFRNSPSLLSALQDDEYVINGTTNGTARSGQTFNTTLSNIRIKLGCWLGAPIGQRFRYPVSGTKSISTSGGTRTIDFGNGNCDASVTYTGINGNTLSLTLPTW
jgi:hypothetical protein